MTDRPAPSVSSGEDRASTTATSFSEDFDLKRPSQLPPPYTPSPFQTPAASVRSGSTNANAADIVLAPSPSSPGYAREDILLRGLQVPTKSKLVSSGFRYPTVLFQAGVKQGDWAAFTAEVVAHARLRPSQWRTTIGKATGALAVGSLMIGLFSVVPSVIVANKTRERLERENLAAAAATSATASATDSVHSANSSTAGPLATCVRRWNDDFFRARGLLVRVDLPGEERDDVASMDVATSDDYLARVEGPGTTGARSLLAQRRAQKADKVLAPDLESQTRRKAVLRGRIVIIPLDAAGKPRAEQRRLSVEGESQRSASFVSSEDERVDRQGSPETEDGRLSFYDSREARNPRDSYTIPE